MKSTDPYLTPEQLRSLLAELGEELASRGRRPTADVVGGAAMALAGIRVTRVTQDVDLVVRSGSSDRQELVEAAARVAARRRTADIPGLPDDWVNDRVAAFSDPPDDDPRRSGRRHGRVAPAHRQPAAAAGHEAGGRAVEGP
ncbi:MAG: hypothetical protein PGN11_15760 [Quadrisphaera sp.]